MNRKKSKLSVKMLASILSFVLAGLAIVTFISVYSSKTALRREIEKEMDLVLSSQMERISGELEKVGALAEDIAVMVGHSYTRTELADYEAMLGELIFTNPVVLGSGIWFEPNVYDPAEKYIGPYIYKEGETAVTTYDYSNAEYDYFAYEFYTGVAGRPKEAVFTQPYYDPTLNVVMSSCSAPVYDNADAFVGVVTVDIELTSIQQIVADITVGEGGKAFLLNETGQIIYREGSTNILDRSMTEESDPVLAQLGEDILAAPEGMVRYRAAAGLQEVYYAPYEPMKWILAVEISAAEQSDEVNALTALLIAAGAAALVLISLVVFFLISSVVRQIRRIQDFAKELSEGNLSVADLPAIRRDELGAMADFLNIMYQNNKGMIKQITGHSHTMDASSVSMYEASDQLAMRFVEVQGLTGQVNDDMALASASTEELNAAAQEVNSSMSLLAAEAEKSTGRVREIEERVEAIAKASGQSYREAERLSIEHQVRIKNSIANAKVVNSISELVEVISRIAKQINMLALNASIEAARAGEQGKGFAVVAGEVGTLAGETSVAVNKIQMTIGEVKKAFDDLVGSADAMLSFVADTVTPDYNTFVDVASQYGKDAREIKEFSTNIAGMANNIESSVAEITQAIQSIADSTQDTVKHSQDIAETMEAVGEVVEKIVNMAIEQETVAKDLNTAVEMFKVD